ncbi:MAG TPA: acyl carrier protein [Rhodopirellula baltica]|uniref:Similar to acyl carrier protein n=2 Tax=Rhodopirellula baltica TaxID=265606 RepID=Q7UV18_RHOBA|nr:acyl carrier protein [Rhodopirellula baltica]CAD72909.1 similar to acyl carrier protein [Rhodopirellula baltica SH 1]HBE63999.1 acyl carrier protein [Rhodopirellula baltica]
MGLDAVEIVMIVEDHFGISIRNDETERVLTVGDLVALIQSRIGAAHIATCPTLTSFLRLRSSVRELTNDQTLRIRIGTRVVDMMNRTQRRQLWAQLDDILGTAAPGLRRPAILRKLLAFLATTTFVIAFLGSVTIDVAILPLTLALAACATLALHIITIPFRSIPPDAAATFGAIARRMAGISVATKQLHLRTDEEILHELRPIVAATLGTDGSKITRTTRFIEDLGMG